VYGVSYRQGWGIDQSASQGCAQVEVSIGQRGPSRLVLAARCCGAGQLKVSAALWLFLSVRYRPLLCTVLPIPIVVCEALTLIAGYTRFVRAQAVCTLHNIDTHPCNRWMYIHPVQWYV
jgi:hypothetical protein